MKVVRFKLSGRTAFFKKPDVNTYYYFTYGNIHKIALLGIMGSILGLGGYNTQSRDFKNNVYPEFYEKLKDAKVAIITLNKHGYITKKVQSFNNSVGYASKESGGNLIVKEQWLQEPEWLIYVKIDNVTDEFSNMIKKNKAKFIPYLGTNDHFADITDVSELEVCKIDDIDKVDSIFETDYFKIDKYQDEEDDSDTAWKYTEYLPAALDKDLNQYQFSDFTETNMCIESVSEGVDVYKDEELDKNLYFF
ncbi:type I-B CRISPR-associated protein Cas5b [Clostridium sp. JN-1]|uniref:type I-B CRISPR-associated protein Cas5b n=1 Tax=Clostridium sp. JN-1 TaxID=2483110 RepID=UPI000F0BA723|nr:type I-B CRISPR-associated protein Cas5b [Clostridium sp. JN-1]